MKLKYLVSGIMFTLQLENTIFVVFFFLSWKAYPRSAQDFHKFKPPERKSLTAVLVLQQGLGGILWKGSDIHWLIYKKSKMAPKGRWNDLSMNTMRIQTVASCINRSS